jgi:hypothetical protein
MSNTDTPFAPLTGSADLVLRKAQRYEELGVAIARSVVTLQHISDADENKSKAVSALKESAANVARDIGKAQERYSRTAASLIVYAGVLKTAQDDALAAISSIRHAEGELATARTNKANAANAAVAVGADQAANQKIADSMADSFDDRSTELHATQDLWHAARELKAAAARVAAESIDGVVNGDVGGQLNDSWWDDVGKIKNAITKICEIAGVLSIFLAWVPILGAVLVGLAALGAIIALVDASVKLSRGEGSVSGVVFAAIGVVLAAFGGKLVSYLGKLAKFTSAGSLAGRASKTQGLYAPVFKKVFGVASKNAAKKELVRLTSFKGAMKEILQSPFDLKLGRGSSLSQQWLAGAKTGVGEFAHNPLKLNTRDMPWSHLTTGAKVALCVLDIRQVGGSLETIVNNTTDRDVALKPESLLKGAANAVESAVRR